MKLVASAIVRNEAGRYLEAWLGHLLTFCDEVRLLDDGSTDDTFALAETFEGVYAQRNHGPAFFEHESGARNALLQWTMLGQPDYVLAIDADEFIGDAVALRGLMMTHPAPVYALWMREAWKIHGDQLGLRIDGMWGDRRCPLVWRAPPVLKGSRWRIPNRKLACGREPLGIRGQRGFDTQIGIYHFGWTCERDREARAERYFEHDGGRFHANAHLQSILNSDEQVILRWVPWPPSIPDAVAQAALGA